MDRLTHVPFWFLRHGETDWNLQNLSQGDVDIPLNATGRAQARQAAELMRGHTVVTIVSSTLSRAMDTAAAVSAVTGVPFTTDDGLRETKFGEQEGKPMGDWYDDWIAGTYTPEGAETFAGLRARVVGAINRALENPAPVLIVAHGALFRAVRSAMGLEPNVRTPNAVPIFCEPPAAEGAAWTLTPAEIPAVAG
ncbi:MAG TPA: histidine phosphatase family protein [Acidisoma sp.]|jgi:broad specificity phosphatase PhoE|uniref:histidine phosphatase family protein n=1 Tax=Acidisoma sp. TaxID=1872115 RepID=UPI002C4F3DCA|nr:histidine phosphatase family protein [Acidisoma sp.]HTI03567.1 histidine phosphatase family protein [Acidisoma sp.]